MNAGRSSGVDPRVERTRQVVCEAAVELMASEGIERLTIDAIAQRSGVARSTIYRNWPDRAELLGAAFESVACGHADHSTLPLDALIRHKAAGLALDLTEHAWGHALPAVVAAAAHDDAVRQALTRFRTERLQEWLDALELAVERGELAAVPDGATGALDRFVAGFFLRHLISFEPLDQAFQDQQIAALRRDLGLDDPPDASQRGTSSSPAPTA